MESSAELAAEETKCRREKDDVLGTMSGQPTDRVDETGLNIEVAHTSADGTHRTPECGSTALPWSPP